MGRVYLDHASATPLPAEILQAMLPFLGESFGNPSSPHARGAAAREAVERARDSVGSLLNASGEEIIFTASASEANNLALKGVAMAAGDRRRHLIAAATEHLSVLHPLRTLERQGHPVTLLPVDRNGVVDPGDLRAALRPDTLLVSLAHASGEIGTLQDLAEIGRVTHTAGVLLHSDAAMTAGSLPWPTEGTGPDLVTISPLLFQGPQGVAALRVRRGVRLAPLIEGGAQEGGLRAGTEPVAAIVGFGAAARRALTDMVERGDRAARLARRLRRILSERIEALLYTGHPEVRVPGHLSLCIGGTNADALLSALDANGIEASSGSACTTVVRKPSHVLEAIGVDPVVARGALIFSFGERNDERDPGAVGEILPSIVARLRELSPLPFR
jgi:cysteine desulfurase